MFLKLDAPSAWRARPEGHLVRLVLDEGLSMEIPDLAPVPEDVWDWSRGCASRDVPASAAAVTITNAFDTQTKLGWPIAVYESVAKNAAGEDVEVRIHAVFAMIEYGTIVVVRARSAAAMATHREAVLSSLETARPDWGTPPQASLRDLFAT